MQQPLPVVFLLALPASGKSETRKFLRTEGTAAITNCAIGDTVQLDDYPYVEVMRFFDDELVKLGAPRIFFYGPYYTFKDPYEWGTLAKMLNEDYHRLVNRQRLEVCTPTMWLMERIDRARAAVGRFPVFQNIPPNILAGVAAALDKHCAKIIQDLNALLDVPLQGKTIMIEFARGGGIGGHRFRDFFPLPEPYGYQYTMAQFDREILEKAAILYVQVNPEDSRRKNEERAPKSPEDDTGVFHCVPDLVMYADYGCDDMEYLMKTCDRPGCIKVMCRGEPVYVPTGKMVNTPKDLTSFVRLVPDPKDWPKQNKDDLLEALISAFKPILSQYRQMHPGF